MSRKTRPLPHLGRLRELFRYDAETGILHRISGGRGAAKLGPCGCLLNTGYLIVGIDGHMYGVHRVCWALAHGRDPAGGEIDHINGIPSDNRIGNLRFATSSENNRNRKISTRNKSGVKGVCWERRPGKWRATLMASGKLHFLGHFTDLDEAAAVVAAKRAELHGSYAHHGVERHAA